MAYCKLIEGRLVFAPKKITIDDATIYNPTPEQLISQGWKPLVIEDAPEVEDGYHLEPTYTEEPNRIVQDWTVVQDDPVEPTPEERIEALEEELRVTKILLGVE